MLPQAMTYPVKLVIGELLAAKKRTPGKFETANSSGTTEAVHDGRGYTPFRISGPRSRIAKSALLGVALLPVLQVPLGAVGAMPLESNAYLPCPVAPAYEPVLLPERIL